MKDTELNYSELLYLHADKYVPAPGFLQNSEELPSGKKLSVVKLGNLEAEVAFAYLYFNGHINIEIQNKKIFGFIPKKVVVSTKKSKGTDLTSLEKSIFDLSDGKIDISTILYRLIGDECSVPWSVVVGVTKKSLVDKEFLIEEKITKKIIVNYYVYKYHLNPKRDYDFKDEIRELDEKLKEFSQKDFYKQLVKDIDSGINSQKEKPDTSD
ncbi:MAG: hypothetical protein WC744_03270 [Patescibacteria group bacterium]